MSKSEVNEKVIAALLRERATLEGRGLDERVAQVDQELKNRGYKVESKITDSRSQPPQGRSTTPKQTTIKD